LSVQTVYSFCKQSVSGITDILAVQKKNLHWLNLFWRKCMLLQILHQVISPLHIW